MAEAKRECEENRRNPPSADFSLLQAGSGDSILRDTSWPQNDDNSYASSRANRSTAFEETVESNQLHASHFALATAYARVTKKLAQAEQRNQLLMMQESLRSQDSFHSGKMSGAAGSQTNLAMAPPDVHASVSQAWEAYNEKCKECQQLREDLEEVKQRNNNAEHFSRLKNLQDDVLREKAKQDDVVRRLEKTKMEADHLGKKEILAREELEKEREYQRSLIQSAEKKHREMEQRIEELERNLENEKLLTEDLRKREKNRNRVLEDEFNARKEVFLSKIKELDERNIQLKEEVSVLVSMQSANYNGPSTSVTQINGLIDGSLYSADGERDAAILESDIALLKQELDDLRFQASEQRSILSAVVQDPRIISLLTSPDFRNSILDNTGVLPTKKCNNTENTHKRKKTSSPKARNHVANMQVDDSNSSGATSSPQDIYGPSTTNSEQFSRQIPPKPSDETQSLSTPVIKHAEDIIRVISKGNLQHRRPAKPALRSDIFPPMDVSRVIHVPESSGPQTMPTNRRNSAENLSDEFVPTSQSILYQGIPAGSQPSQYYNGNATVNARPHTNGQTPVSNMQDSLPPMEIDSNQFYSATSSGSMSSTDTLTTSPVDVMPSVRPTNPFYHDLMTPKSPLAPTMNRNQIPQEPIQNSVRNHKPATVETMNVVELGNDISPAPRSPQASSNSETPGNRYVSTSDEESESGSYIPRLQQQDRGHQPKEFVVPTVVRPEDLAAQGASNRKAFQDSGYSAPQVQTPTRPAIRARPESPTQARTNQPEGGRKAAAPAHQYPNKPKQNQEECQKCPICHFVFSSEWNEDRMNRHINGHFSDEDNLLSFD